MIGCDGFATFDRESGRVDQLDFNRVETRQAGPVEAGLDMKSTLTVTRHPADPSDALSDPRWPRSLAYGRQREFCRWPSPAGERRCWRTAIGTFSGKTPGWQS